MLLAIDTATRVMSVALHDGENVIAEHTWHTGNRHTTELTPTIRRMMGDCDVTMTDLTALAVSIGPGSYTGLRIGVATAKGIAGVRDLPLVGITTLDALAAAQPQFQSGTALIAVVQAGRGRIIIQTYRWRKSQWGSRSEPRIMDWDSLMNTIDGAAYITGEVNEEGVAAIEAAHARDIPVYLAPPAHRLRRAGFLAQVALDQLVEAGEDRDSYKAAHLTPIYVNSDDG